MIFAAGFAEVGDQNDTQDAGHPPPRGRPDLRSLGPNCLGMTNNVDGMWLHMLFAREARRNVEGRCCLRRAEWAALLGHFQARPPMASAFPPQLRDLDRQRGRPRRHRFRRVSSLRTVPPRGDRASLLRTDPPAGGIPRRLFAAHAAAGKTDRADASGPAAQRARKAALSHTGALIGDFATMAHASRGWPAPSVAYTHGRDDGSRPDPGALSPEPPAKGAWHSHRLGAAYVGLTNDFAEEVGLELPELEPATLKRVGEVLSRVRELRAIPSTVTAGVCAGRPLSVAAKALLDDPNTGMLFLSFPINAARPVESFNKGMVGSTKPKVMVAARRHLAARPRRHGKPCAREPGRILRDRQIA